MTRARARYPLSRHPGLLWILALLSPIAVILAADAVLELAGIRLLEVDRLILRLLAVLPGAALFLRLRTDWLSRTAHAAAYVLLALLLLPLHLGAVRAFYAVTGL
jgi:hypothetical protein